MHAFIPSCMHSFMHAFIHSFHVFRLGQVCTVQDVSLYRCSQLCLPEAMHRPTSSSLSPSNRDKTFGSYMSCQQSEQQQCACATVVFCVKTYGTNVLTCLHEAFLSHAAPDVYGRRSRAMPCNLLLCDAGLLKLCLTPLTVTTRLRSRSAMASVHNP